jgi:hypothetical protein
MYLQSNRKRLCTAGFVRFPIAIAFRHTGVFPKTPNTTHNSLPSFWMGADRRETPHGRRETPHGLAPANVLLARFAVKLFCVPRAAPTARGLADARLTKGTLPAAIAIEYVLVVAVLAGPTKFARARGWRWGNLPTFGIRFVSCCCLWGQC